MKRLGLSVLMVLLALSVVLAGCGEKEGAASAQESLEKAIQASMNMNSYEFETSVQFAVNLPDAVLENEPEALMAMEMLKNAQLSAHGVYQKDPMRAEVTLELALKGDMAINFNVPMILTEEKMYVKVPNIPFLAGLIPQEMVNKYILLDMKELAELSGEPIPEIDMEKQQRLALDLFKVINENFDEEDFFTTKKAEKEDLPEGVNAKEVITFAITNDNFDKAVTQFVQLLPKFVEVLSKEEYAEMLNLSEEDFAEFEEEFKVDEAEIEEALAEMKETLTINEISITTAIDKDQFMPYQLMKLDLDIAEDGETMGFEIQVENVLTNINKKAEFKIDIPADDEVIDLMDLQNQMMMSF